MDDDAVCDVEVDDDAVDDVEVDDDAVDDCQLALTHAHVDLWDHR